jgi:single-strand DNA-binding protein
VTWTDRESGDRKERSQWHNVVAYGDHFPKFAARIIKGAYVLVQGELLTRSYEKTIQVTVGKKTVDQTIKALAVELKADTIKLLDRSSSNSTEEQPSDEQPPF